MSRQTIRNGPASVELDWRGDELRSLGPDTMKELRKGVAAEMPSVRRQLGRRSGKLRRNLGVSRVQRNADGTAGFFVGFRSRFPFKMRWPGGKTPAETVRAALKPLLPGLARTAAKRAAARKEKT